MDLLRVIGLVAYMYLALISWLNIRRDILPYLYTVFVIFALLGVGFNTFTIFYALGISTVDVLLLNTASIILRDLWLGVLIAIATDDYIRKRKNA
jgi:hypothetical protein